jgi:uncharacterized cofD-like protein
LVATPSKRKVIDEIEKADVIIMGPGDLYSSIIPSLLVGGISEAIKKSKAKRIYICNIMTKLGETNNFSVLDFANEIEKYLGEKLNYVIYNTEKSSVKRLNDYRKKRPELLGLVKVDSDLDRKKFIGKNLLTKTGSIIHDSDKLIKTILSLF